MRQQQMTYPEQNGNYWDRVIIIALILLALTMVYIRCSNGSMPENHHAYIDYVTLAHVNHFYSAETGKLTYDQVIWYNWNEKESRFDVVDWRILKKVRGEIDKEEARQHWLDPKNVPPPDPKWLGGHATPILDYRLDKWVSVWYDGNVFRKVYADHFRDTWTDIDPELTERAFFLPQNKRRGLKKVRR